MGKAVGIATNHYETLGLPRTASALQIQTCYRDAIALLQISPQGIDRQEEILDLTRAYSVLSNPEQRSRYDRTLDFDVVVLDKDIDKTDLADESLKYKKFCSLHYDDVLSKFNYFKSEMNLTLWIIKVISIFFFLNFLGTITVLYFLYKTLDHSDPLWLNRYLIQGIREHTFLMFLGMVVLNFWIFNYLWIKPSIKVHYSKNQIIE